MYRFLCFLFWFGSSLHFFFGGGGPIEILSLLSRRNFYRWCTANLLGTNRHWAVFFRVPHLLWHGASVYNDPWHSHLLPSVWQWNCHYLLSWLSSVGDLHTKPSGCEASALTECANGAVVEFLSYDTWFFVLFCNNKLYFIIYQF